MDREQFSDLVVNYTALTKEEADRLIELEKEYPYCQAIQVLTACATRDYDLKLHEYYLHRSAIHSTDRQVLKNIITAPKTDRIVLRSEKESTQSVSTISEIQPINLSGDSLVTEVMKDLERLKELKHQFEDAARNFEGRLSEGGKSEKKTKKKEVPVEDGLIEEIKSSKKKIKTENPKQKEQIEIIDQFIKTQPVIGKIKQASAKADNDLSENSALFSENIISETLVDILIKQGKKDKAIEVLKKLIWKFPQKKAYFAAQIEELKK